MIIKNNIETDVVTDRENDDEKDNESGEETDEEDRKDECIEGNQYNNDDVFNNGNVIYYINRKHLKDKQFKHGNKVKCDDCQYISWNMKELYKPMKQKHCERLIIDNEKYDNI